MARQFTPAGGSVIQLLLSTVPFLCVFLYFLYSAYKRPSLAVYNIPMNLDDDYVIGKIYDETGPQIALMEMLWVFLAALLAWAMLVVYIHFIIPQRRTLMKRYLAQDGSAISVLGDVHYDDDLKDCCRRWCAGFSDYARVSYTHPNPEQITARQKQKYGTGLTYMVSKQVRTYQLYTRERVSILLLPDLPFSGQPASDVRVDVSTFGDNRNKLQAVVVVGLVWMAFLILAPLYIIHQMSKIEDDYENDERAWVIYLLAVFLVIPLLAFGVNYVRYYWYRRWLLRGGKIVKGVPGSALPVTTVSRDEADDVDEEGGIGGILMNDLCAATMDTQDDGGGGGGRQQDPDRRAASSTNYRRMD